MSTNTSTTARPRSDAGARCKPLLAAIAAVIVVGLVALVVTLLQDEDVAATAFDTATTRVGGAALSTLDDPANDPAVGQTAPVIQGTDRDGSPLVAPASGQPTVLLFMAHWCPHCQAEVPVVQDWVDAGELPAGVDLVGVATATQANRPNYPPSAWLEREGWTVPTIGDASGAAALTYGVSAFPFWVAVDGDGRVVERRTGELTPAQITQLTEVAAA